MINKTAAIIAAAGAGNRLGADLPKALVKLVDKTLVEHAVANLAPVAQLIVVTAPTGFVDEYRKLLGDSVEVIEGYRDWETDRKSTRLNSSHRL